MEKQITEIIKEAIATKGVYEVLYANAKGEERTFHVFDARYAEGYGERAIDVRCMENNKDMILAVSRIQRIEKYWVDISDETKIIPEDGIYLFSGIDNNGCDYALNYMHKGDNVHYCEKINRDLEIPLAYHRVKDDKECWIKTSKKDIDTVSLDVVMITRYVLNDASCQEKYIRARYYLVCDDVLYRVYGPPHWLEEDSDVYVYPVFMYRP